MKKFRKGSLSGIMIIRLACMVAVCKEEDNEPQNDNDSPQEAVDQIRLEEDNILGVYLANADARAVYYFSENESDCEGTCIENWPFFASNEVVAPSYLESEYFGEISRNDDESQLTFKGRPVYYFKGDAVCSETNGDQVNEVWFLFNTSILEEAW